MNCHSDWQVGGVGSKRRQVINLMEGGREQP